MSIIAKSEGENNFQPIPEGVYTAICYGLIDIGMQYSEQFKKSAHKIMIMWELPDELYKDDEGNDISRVTSREYTLSLDEKATLRKDLQAWRGKAFTEQELEGFDMSNIVGKGCQLQIIHKESGGKTYANIAGIMSLPKGYKTGDPMHTVIFIDLSEPETLKDIQQLPLWIQKKVTSSETYKAIGKTLDTTNIVDGEVGGDDSVPF